MKLWPNGNPITRESVERELAKWLAVPSTASLEERNQAALLIDMYREILTDLNKQGK
jgi:hypothetical protein